MAKSSTIWVINKTGSTIAAGKIVYVSGYDQTYNLQKIALADCSLASKLPAMGMVMEDVASGDKVKIKILGVMGGFDTSNYAVNTPVYVGYDGEMEFKEPTQDNINYYTQQLGVVARSKKYPYGQIDLLPLEIKRGVRHIEIVDVEPDQHHNKLHAEQHHVNGNDQINHDLLGSLDTTSHDKYILIDGTRPFSNEIVGPNIKTTVEGGYAIKLINKTGALSVKGEVVRASRSFGDSVDLVDGSGSGAIGVFYDSGVADGNEAWVVVSGMADVKLKNDESSSLGAFIIMSDVDGRALSSLSEPTTIAGLLRKIGSCLETVTAPLPFPSGVGLLTKCVLHFA